MIPKDCLKQFPTEIANIFQRKTDNTPKNIFIIKKKKKENFKLLSKKAETNVRQAQHT